MDEDANHNGLEIYCEVHNAYLAKDKVMDHLKTSRHHKIYKKLLPNLKPENYQIPILDRIQKISHIQVKIQISSAELIKNIMENTQLVLFKLGNLIQLYRDLLQTNNFNEELKNLNIVNNYRVSESLKAALENHFNQKFVVEDCNINTNIQKVKKIVKKIRDGRTSNFRCMEISSDETIFIIGETNGIIRVYNFKTKLQICIFFKHKSTIFSLALGLENKLLLSGSADFTLRLWDLNKKKQIHKFIGHKSAISSVLITPNNKLGMSGSFDRTVKIWNLETMQINFTLSFNIHILHIKLISRGEILFVGGIGRLNFYDIEKRRNKYELKIPIKYLFCIKFTESENQIFLGFSSGDLQIYETKTLIKIFESRNHSSPINKIEIIPILDLFATCSDGRIILWDAKKLAILKVLNFELFITDICLLKSSSK